MHVLVKFLAKKRRGWADRIGDALADPRRARRLTRPVHWGLAALFRTRSRDAWVALFDGSDACTTPVLTLEEALAHPQVQARDMAPEGGLGCPLHFDGRARATLVPSPELGADNERLLGARR